MRLWHHAKIFGCWVFSRNYNDKRILCAKLHCKLWVLNKNPCSMSKKTSWFVINKHYCACGTTQKNVVVEFSVGIMYNANMTKIQLCNYFCLQNGIELIWKGWRAYKFSEFKCYQVLPKKSKNKVSNFSSMFLNPNIFFQFEFQLF